MPTGLAQLQQTRDLLSQRLMTCRVRDSWRIMKAIDRIDNQRVRVISGLPRHPHSHGYSLPVDVWSRDVDREAGWL